MLQFDSFGYFARKPNTTQLKKIKITSFVSICRGNYQMRRLHLNFAHELLYLFIFCYRFLSECGRALGRGLAMTTTTTTTTNRLHSRQHL